MISGATLVRSKGEEVYRFLFFYPCHGGALINVVGIHPDSRRQDKPSEYDTCSKHCSAAGSKHPLVPGWNTPATREQFLHEFGDFHARYRSFIELADDPVMLFRLRTVPILPTWVNGRVLGDAAHATFPSEYKPVMLFLI